MTKQPMTWWMWTLGTIAVLWFFWWFVHRDPERPIVTTRGFLSPADGVVVHVEKLKDTKARVKKGKKGGFDLFVDDFPEAKYAVVIMLKIWHVHTQRAPVSGKISSVYHKDGGFRNAVFGEYLQATYNNEHQGVLISGEKRCKVYMVAKLIARRIVCLVQQGDVVQQGDKIAKIRLGSQVVLVLPESQVIVKPGDKVYAGLTEVAL